MVSREFFLQPLAPKWWGGTTNVCLEKYVAKSMLLFWRSCLHLLFHPNSKPPCISLKNIWFLLNILRGSGCSLEVVVSPDAKPVFWLYLLSLSPNMNENIRSYVDFLLYIFCVSVLQAGKCATFYLLTCCSSPSTLRPKKYWWDLTISFVIAKIKDLHAWGVLYVQGLLEESISLFSECMHPKDHRSAMMMILFP